MTARVHVEQDFARDGLAIYLGERFDNGRLAVVEPVELVLRTTESAEAVYTPSAPSLRLPEHMARALLDALAAHFGGVAEVQTLRKDYLAERARVDKMIDHLTSRP